VEISELADELNHKHNINQRIEVDQPDSPPEEPTLPQASVWDALDSTEVGDAKISLPGAV
jgi:hypothetical protein